MPQPTPDAINRIRTTVKRVEADPYDFTGSPRSRGNQRQGFWAAVSGGGPRYNWTMMVPDNTSLFVEASPPVTGTITAVEINEVANVPDGTMVKLAFVGFNENGDPLYAFAYNSDANPWAVPLHDHRDNQNGALAFGIYSPGSNFPQNRRSI